MAGMSADETARIALWVSGGGVSISALAFITASLQALRDKPRLRAVAGVYHADFPDYKGPRLEIEVTNFGRRTDFIRDAMDCESHPNIFKRRRVSFRIRSRAKWLFTSYGWTLGSKKAQENFVGAIQPNEVKTFTVPDGKYDIEQMIGKWVRINTSTRPYFTKVVDWRHPKPMAIAEQRRGKPPGITSAV